MDKLKILITGSEGALGTILKQGLKDKFELYKLDLVESAEDNYFKVDISDFEKLEEVFQKTEGLYGVIHLAAAHGDNSTWPEVLKNNIIGARNMFECASKVGVKRFIFMSSNHVSKGYEKNLPELDQQKKLVSVNDPPKPISDYGMSKVIGEVIARRYFEEKGLSTICIRSGAVRQDPTENDRFMRIWLSPRDFVQLFEKALLTEQKFGVYYGISNNARRFYNISNTQKELGFEPVDDAEKFKTG